MGQTVIVAKPDDSAPIWKGVSGGEIGSFPKEYVMDTKGLSKEELLVSIVQSGVGSQSPEGAVGLDVSSKHSFHSRRRF